MSDILGRCLRGYAGEDLAIADLDDIDDLLVTPPDMVVHQPAGLRRVAITGWCSSPS